MNQQSVAPMAKRSPVLPLAVGLVAALAYGAGVVTSTLVASNSSQANAGHVAPVTSNGSTTQNEHKVEPGPNEF